MKDYCCSFVILAIFISFLSCKNNKSVSEKDAAELAATQMDIYLLIGQSNMAGRAIIEEQDKDTLSNVFLFTLSDEEPWEKAANPLNIYSTIRKKVSMQRLSPAYTFAKDMAASSEGRPIGLVVNAKGGTNINEWLPGTEFYEAAVERTKDALSSGELKGIAWHQGESNASKYDAYMPKMITLIKALRTEFDVPNLPIVVGQLSPDKPSRFNFNEMILTLPEQINRVAVVSTEGTTTTDSTHFDARSQRLLGERYAVAMQKLLLSQE